MVRSLEIRKGEERRGEGRRIFEGVELELLLHCWGRY